MKFKTAGDNRNGSVSVKSGRKGDARGDNYNVDPSQQYKKINRKLSEQAGSIAASLETESEFIGYANGECSGLALKSKGTITPPKDATAQGHATVQESIWMNIRIEQTGKVQLTASVVSDLDIAEVTLEGPSFAKAVKIYDDYDKTLDITKPGDYRLKGGYQLSAEFPNTGLGGRPITVEITAKLTPV